MFDQMGKTLVFVGAVIALIGLLMWLGGKLGAFRLPGDIVYRRGNFTFYFPLMTSILLSLLLTAILWLLGRR